jgi:dihydroflavonol-4-reductase
MSDEIVLVTGGTGFVGSYILRYLLGKGYKVKALKRSSSPMHLVSDIQNQIDWIEGDILDVPFLDVALKGVDLVFHVAAMISFNPAETKQMMKVNVEGTANIVNAALCHKIKKLVHVSSIAAIGRKEFQSHIDEKMSWENSKMNSNYAISKFKAECEVWRAMQEGLHAVIVNPSVILGAGFWDSGSCKLFEKMWKGLKYYPQGGTGFVDVRDVAKASVALMESDISGERYILNSENCTFRHFFATTALALKKAPPARKANPLLIAILWRLDWLSSKLFKTNPLLTKETIRTSRETYYYSNNKIINDLNFTFNPVDDCINETAKVFLKSKTSNQHFGILPLI